MSTSTNSTPGMSSKRKRDPTFRSSEKELLLQLVRDHFSIVESKKTDAVSMRNKAEEWCKISEVFNAASAICPRHSNVLKNCWENMKKRARQEQTSRNQHYLGTGGGPPKKEAEEPRRGTEEQRSEYTPGMLKKQKNAVLNFMLAQDSQECETIKISNPKRARTDYMSSTSRRRPVCQAAETQANEKIESLKKANHHADEEHQLKISILNTQLQKEQELLSQAKIKTRQEEIKLEILELELKKVNDLTI